MSEQSAAAMTLTDFQIEQFASNGYQDPGCACCSKRKNAPTWRQYVQRAVNLMVNDWYAHTVGQRNLSLLFSLLHRHFDSLSQRFHSEGAFLELREVLIGHLDRFLLTRQQAEYPLFVFERSKLWIEALEMELSMVFQVLEQKGDRLVLRRYVTDVQPEWRRAYFHMATVYCQQAFPGQLAEIELLSVISGDIVKYRPDSEKHRRALDYMKLVKGLYYGQTATCNRGQGEAQAFMC